MGPKIRIRQTISFANLEPADEYKSIKLSAESTGSFTVTNTRNGFSKTYKPVRGASK
jgi:hypothetical protein